MIPENHELADDLRSGNVPVGVLNPRPGPRNRYADRGGARIDL
jgi:hypothetical protein